MIYKSVELDVIHLKGVECSKLFELTVDVSSYFISASVLNRLDFELSYIKWAFDFDQRNIIGWS